LRVVVCFAPIEKPQEVAIMAATFDGNLGTGIGIKTFRRIETNKSIQRDQ